MKPISWIRKYSGYFHDGSIRGIETNDNDLVISVESAEIYSEWPWDRKSIPLSRHSTITGKLHLKGVERILINGKKSHKFKMIYEKGTIFDLDIEKKIIKLEVIWKQYVPVKKETGIVDIEVGANDIIWEHIPDLFEGC